VVAGYLLDTTVLIDHAAGTFGASDLVERLFGEPGDIYTCDAVAVEALSAGNDEERGLIDRIVTALEYVATSPQAARYAADVRRARGRSSRRHLGDAIIAGVAWSLEATVVTRNPRDFEGYGVAVLTYGNDDHEP
jgi:predicted nucleic acid-binding protein